MLTRVVGAGALVFWALAAYFGIVALVAGGEVYQDRYQWLVVGGWVAAGACAIPAFVLTGVWTHERDQRLVSEQPQPQE